MHTASVVLFDYRCRFSSISCALFFCAALVPVCVCVCVGMLMCCHALQALSCRQCMASSVFPRILRAICALCSSVESARFNCLKCKLSVANSRRRRALLDNSDGFAEQTCFFVVVSLTLVWKACRYLQWSLIFIFQQHVYIIPWYDVHRIRKASTRVVLLLLLFCVSPN